MLENNKHKRQSSYHLDSLASNKKTTAFVIKKCNSKLISSERKPQVMTNSEPFFHFYLNLPSQILLVVSTFWDQKDICQVNLALVGFYMYYSKKFPVTINQPMGFFLHRQFKIIPEAGKLLHAVVYANYEEAKIAIKENPSLMFKHVNFRYHDGSSECISPLKYAFKIYDTYMWENIFYEKIKDNSIHMKEFIKQAHEQTTHINLQSLFDAYEKYEKQLPLWLSEEITQDQLDTTWFELGAQQLAQLPMHMLKEFSQGGGRWNAAWTFDVKAMLPPVPSQIYDHITQTGRTLSSIISDRGFGRSFTLVRGKEPSLSAKGVGNRGRPQAREDLATFRNLLERRKNDLFEKISSLMKNSPHIVYYR